MANNFRKADERMNASAVKLYDELDKKVLSPIFDKSKGNIKEIFDSLKKELPEAIKQAFAAPVETAKQAAGAVADKAERLDKVLNTPIKLEISYKPVPGTPAPTATPK